MEVKVEVVKEGGVEEEVEQEVEAVVHGGEGRNSGILGQSESSMYKLRMLFSNR